MFLPLPAMLVATPLIIAAADSVPSFDVNPTCRGAASTAGGGGRGSDVCVRTELGARDQLARQWVQFPSADRTRCVQLTNMTHMPSYVQVLTCLEMARDARQLETSAQRSTVGSGQ
jgi:hypothetical protein